MRYLLTLSLICLLLACGGSGGSSTNSEKQTETTPPDEAQDNSLTWNANWDENNWK